MRIRHYLFLLVFIGLISCEKEKLIEENSLPAAALDYIGLHYSNQEIVQIIRIRENVGGIAYSVILNDGSKLKFEKSGTCRSIERGSNGIPDSVILPKILEYVHVNYESEEIVEWDKDKKIIEIELSNGLELMFTEEGEFLKIDS